MSPSGTLDPQSQRNSILRRRLTAKGARDIFLGMLDESVKDATILFRMENLSLAVGARRGEPNKADVTIRVISETFFSRVLCYGNLGLGEAYMRGDFEIENGSLHDFLTILMRNRMNERVGKDVRVLLKIGAYRFANAVFGKEKNVQRHYDIGFDLFESFLDSRLVYSCGYANTSDDDLEQLQTSKLHRICRKLRLTPSDHLLDIGCGFGGLLMFAATEYAATGIGITISRDHFEMANAIVRGRGLSDRVRIELKDHLAIDGKFDRVVSVGMLEHVPRSEYKYYFRNIARILKPDGIGLVHAVSCNSSRNQHDPFIQKYIFPASNQPRLSEITGALERNHLAILDVENIIRHYRPTALWWLKRFQANQNKLNQQKYDRVFQRMWEYYLSCAIAAAGASDAAVFQVLFAKDYSGPIPLTRV
jgi:cyclopropane-fatty-acyl-phospholipid synthase